MSEVLDVKHGNHLQVVGKSFHDCEDGNSFFKGCTHE